MPDALPELFRKAAEGCPCELGIATCLSHDPAVTDCPCAVRAGHGEDAPEEKLCAWPGHAALREIAEGLNAQHCWCSCPTGPISECEREQEKIRTGKGEGCLDPAYHSQPTTVCDPCLALRRACMEAMGEIGIDMPPEN